MFAAVSYLRAGVLLHIITVLEVFLLAALAPEVSHTEAGFHADLLWDAALLLFLTVLPCMSQLDARSRFQEYKRLKDQLMKFGFDSRLLKPLVTSRCQRDAARTAARELGYGSHCREFYALLGYRWYHLTPDFLFSDPRFLISRQFWKSTFFLATYPKAKS